MSNVPGFTAEASLRKPRAYYRTAFAGPPNGPPQLVTPQSFLGAIGDFFEGLGNLLWDGVKCTAATTKVGVECTVGLKEGDVGGCANALSEWSESCIKD